MSNDNDKTAAKNLSEQELEQEIRKLADKIKLPDELKKKLDMLLDVTSSDETRQKAAVDLLGKEKLPCGHTTMEHAAAEFLVRGLLKAGMEPDLIVRAAEIVANEIDIRVVEIGRKNRGGDDVTGSFVSPMPKDVQ